MSFKPQNLNNISLVRLSALDCKYGITPELTVLDSVSFLYPDNKIKIHYDVSPSPQINYQSNIVAHVKKVVHKEIEFDKISDKKVFKFFNMLNDDAEKDAPKNSIDYITAFMSKGDLERYTYFRVSIFQDLGQYDDQDVEMAINIRSIAKTPEPDVLVKTFLKEIKIESNHYEMQNYIGKLVLHCFY